MTDPKVKQDEKPKPDDAEQSRRFEETAHKLGADESGEVFERALDTVTQPATPRPGASKS